MLSFDAFTVRFEASASLLMSQLEFLGFTFTKRERALYGYEISFLVSCFGESCGLFQYGGKNIGSGVYISINGEYSNNFRDFCLSSGFVFYLLRADIKIDLDGSKYFDLIKDNLINLAEQKNINTSTVGDWIQQKQGRTLYFGSRTSVYFIRLYEKYKQKGYDFGGQEIIRLELEIKPSKQNRLAAARLSALQLLNTYPLANDIFGHFLETGEGVTLSSPKKDSDHERALKALKKQYAKTLHKELANHHGDLVSFAHSLLIN